MLFNSLDFAIFFPLVFIGYWFFFSKTVKLQNTFLLVASYFFYACWDWKFVLLLLGVTVFNFYLGKYLINVLPGRKKTVLVFGILINLLVLGWFKYFNFFVDSFKGAYSFLGYNFEISLYTVILPVGISFYIFQCISYITDVYRGQTEASDDLHSFLLFVAFFPQLISGPIERKNHLMPQIVRKRLFDYPLAVNGMRLILLGLFEKMVIADNCAPVVARIYDAYEVQSGSTLFFGTILYSFQIYGDFSGYSHMAIGCAALLGFTLKDNFRYPYLAKNIADFWRRWHMSFSGWLRDYIYFPLGGSRKGDLIQIRNLIIVFVISGIWHGAKWTFVVYGFSHAVLYICYIYYKKWFKEDKELPSSTYSDRLFDVIAFGFTFTYLTLARVFFKSSSVNEALHYLSIVFSKSLLTKPDMSRGLILCMFLFLGIEYLQKNKKHILDISFIKYRTARYSIYLVMILLICYFSGESDSFIYFKF
ncbi:MAG: membrane-bound O-acyltransferase family protein [Flavobacterium psychrophilum]|nr:MAG: membrane-bound O-acyltransferase family protein [Flavobacterium psychrophilum]